MARIRIFTGKGGVGKTSVAAASALKLAAEGHRTLLASTDAAHSVGDVLDRRVGAAIVRVAENLDAVELDADRIMEEEYGALVGSALSMASSMGGDADDGEMPAMPGMDGLFALLKLIDFAECGAYDRIVVDCAPTGETLALLKFPELFGWYLEKWLPAGKVALRVLSPLSKKLLKLELPDRRAMSDIERLYARLVELQQLLKDPERTSVRIVALPEKMVVEETKRNFLYLNLFGYRADGLVVNRVLPPEAQGGFFAEWADVQKRCMEELAQVFGDLPRAQVPWYGADVCGLEAVETARGRAARRRRVRRRAAGGARALREDGRGLGAHAGASARRQAGDGALPGRRRPCSARRPHDALHPAAERAGRHGRGLRQARRRRAARGVRERGRG